MKELQMIEPVENQFEELFKSYYPFVVRQVMRIIPKQSTAEDIAQEVFLQLYHTDRSMIQSLPAWLTKVSYNTSYNYLRSEKRHDARIEKERHHVEHFNDSTESIILQREEVTSVRNTLLKMKELDRNLILMKYEGFSYEEIAEIHQLKKESVGTLLSRAKQKFKTLFQHERGVEQ